MTEIRLLTPRECGELLSSQRIGRLAFSENALPTILPVSFFLHEGDIVLYAGAGPAGRLTKEVVAFEVDSLDPHAHSGWSVVVIGRITPATDLEHVAWTTGEQGRLLRLPVELISGRVLSLRDPDSVSGAATS
ncbi:pyridoxamine 5'-phosphate oxidase family protein [Amycolatopsis acidiphila]|nr:pyridoxamine 5'-phosphate oxidase family protein [Amycolatopsis acidiphila]UIJ62992.1 pyridoxamine 5'-phosphate oxidase family protein [Amycolatopsis acidiphila]GHG65520.1 hypothetical protein GCM10017788_23050 [Amycolatopsis acidiphila]